MSFYHFGAKRVFPVGGSLPPTGNKTVSPLQKARHSKQEGKIQETGAAKTVAVNHTTLQTPHTITNYTAEMLFGSKVLRLLK